MAVGRIGGLFEGMLVAVGVTVVLLVLYAVSLKFRDSSSVAKAIVRTLGKNEQTSLSIRSKRVLLILAAIFIAVPVLYKLAKTYF